MKTSVLIVAVGVLSLSLSRPANAQVPIPGQAYQVPDGYSAYGAGTTIAYGGYSYVIQNDGTMLLADQAAFDDSGSGQAYQVPDGYVGYAAGTTIVYGGNSYVIGFSGTMTLITSKQTWSGGGGHPTMPSGHPTSGWKGGGGSRRRR
jgi:hypothetical protein